MDIEHKNGYGTKQPRGPATTLLDLVSRDLQDNTIFPLAANITRFARDDTVRTVPFTSVFREFTFLGPADFGQTCLFEIGNIDCGDLLQGLFIQVQLRHWLTNQYMTFLKSGRFVYTDPNDLWTYVNSLGTTLLEEATLEIDDQVLERITGDSVNVVSTLFPDLNTQIGLSSVEGRYSIGDVKAWNQKTVFPTDDGWITIPLLFSILRQKLTATFPLLSCRKGTVRVRVKFKGFDQIIRNATGTRADCTDTVLGKTLTFLDTRVPVPQTYTQTVSLQPPPLQNINLLTYGLSVDGPYREMLLRQPFEKPFKEIQQFDFNEPLKYVINKSGNDLITIQLPLEANQPVEEIVWFLRRTAAVELNNDWTNYSGTLERDYDPVFCPLVPILKRAKIQANGMDIVSQDEAWFRSHIARAHKGGKVAYDSYIYGYSFADHPGEHNPSGTLNASRLHSLRLTLDITPPKGSSEGEWEVHVFVFAYQWLRFENGICNKVFSD